MEQQSRIKISQSAETFADRVAEMSPEDIQADLLHKPLQKYKQHYRAHWLNEFCRAILERKINQPGLRSKIVGAIGTAIGRDTALSQEFGPRLAVLANAPTETLDQKILEAAAEKRKLPGLTNVDGVNAHNAAMNSQASATTSLLSR